MTNPTDPDRWVDEHGDALYGYAMLRLRDADVAADLVQETFLQALKGQGSFRGESTERTWLVGILKHKILDRFRGRAARERGIGGDEPEADPGSEFFDEKRGWRIPPGRWGDLPGDLVERAPEFWEVFHACLADLPPTYAEVFTLSELEGLTGPRGLRGPEDHPGQPLGPPAPGPAPAEARPGGSLVRPR